MSLEDVYNAAYDAYNAGYFAQLSAEDVDAIADQIGALSVDEVANAVEGLFALAQAEAEASDFFDWLGNVGNHVGDFVEDTAGHVAHTLSGPAGKAIARAARRAFAQTSADDVDSIADQIGALSVDDIATELEGLLAAQLDAEAEKRRTGA